MDSAPGIYYEKVIQKSIYLTVSLAVLFCFPFDGFSILEIHEKKVFYR